MSNLSKTLLKEKMENLLKYYGKYPNENREENIKKIDKYLNNQEYKIAVVANMSSGKSTFINALFGEEVLPAFNHATTDCATFIYSKPNIEKKAIIYFSDGREAVKIKDNLDEEIKQYAQKDYDCENNKHKNVEKIELFYPFKNLQTSSNEDFSITFIDTPGPNSTGEDYKQKHKDQTRSVLNDIDLALFIFDYSQLDANLSSDEQGLWHTIQKRHEKDENFDVYFLINKIDFALDDNFKDIDTKDKNEFIKQKRLNWYLHEKSAISKLKQAAIKHGISEPQIYPIASKYQLLDRDENKNWDAEDELDNFKKAHFRRLFEKWEDEFINYLGISRIEKDVNKYINTSVKNKILTKINSQLKNVSNDENNDLETRLQTLQKPKQEAEENLKKANDFLQSRAKEMQNEMNKESKKLESKYIEEIEKIIDDTIDKELKSKVNEMAQKTIAFAQAYALDNKINLAIKKAKKSFSVIELKKDIIEIEIKKEIDKEDVIVKMQEFMQTLFDEYKNNYLDLKSDIKEVYFEFEREANKSFSKYKTELEQELENTLDVKTTNLEKQTINYNNMIIMDIKVPNSVLDYNLNEYEVTEIKKKRVKRSKWNPFRWFGDDYTTEKYKEIKTVTQHIFRISPKELTDSIESGIEESINKFSNEEKKIHRQTIESFLKNNSNIFQDFRHNKQKEIDKIQKEIKSRENSLKEIKTQYDEFKNTQKDKL